MPSPARAARPRRRTPPRSATRGGIRLARREDDAVLAQSAVRAFRFGDVEGWTTYFAKHDHRAPTDTWIDERASGIAGHVTALRMRVSVAGGEMPMRGYAAVSVVPEARREGVADRLMRRSLRDLWQRGEPLAMLYPFDVHYYARFGFARCEWSEVLALPPSAFPSSPLRASVRALDWDRDEANLRAVYDAWRSNRTGPFERSNYWWSERVRKRVTEGVVFHPHGASQPSGYMLYEIPPERAFGDQWMVVREFVALTPAAHRGLWGFLAALGEQYRSVRVATLPNEWRASLGTVLPTASVERFGMQHLYGSAGGGAMARLVRVDRAIAQHPAARRATRKGRVVIALTDPVIREQTRRYVLVCEGTGGVRVTRESKPSPALKMDVGTLTQIALGGARATSLVQAGTLEGPRESAAVLDEWFDGPALWMGTLNGF